MKDWKQLFLALNQSETGASLVAYLETVLDDICDIRKEEEMTPEIRKVVAKIIQERIIDRVKLVNQPVKNRDEME